MRNIPLLVVLAVLISFVAGASKVLAAGSGCSDGSAYRDGGMGSFTMVCNGSCPNPTEMCGSMTVQTSPTSTDSFCICTDQITGQSTMYVTTLCEFHFVRTEAGGGMYWDYAVVCFTNTCPTTCWAHSYWTEPEPGVNRNIKECACGGN